LFGDNDKKSLYTFGTDTIFSEYFQYTIALPLIVEPVRCGGYDNHDRSFIKEVQMQPYPQRDHSLVRHIFNKHRIGQGGEMAQTMYAHMNK
jgi:hypothetical protein